MSFYYSPETNCFYAEGSKELYEANHNWPKDCLKVSDVDFNIFALGEIPANKTRGFEQGKLCWVDIVVSDETLQSQEILWTEQELNRIRDELEKVQDSDSGSYGTVADWREYRKLVRAWPSDTKFPNTVHRPKFSKE